MDSAALSLGPTWRSSEERAAVSTHLCPDHEVRSVPTTAQASWGQSQAWPPWGWDGCWLVSVNFFQKE